MSNTVFAVVYDNYDPMEIDSLWATRELAQKHADILGSPWQVVEIKVKQETTND